MEDSCMQIYDSPLCSLCLIMCTFPTNQTRQEGRLAGAQLLIVTVCSVAKRALMRGVGGTTEDRVVYVPQEADFICSLRNSLDGRKCAGV